MFGVLADSRDSVPGAACPCSQHGGHLPGIQKDEV